LESIHLSVNDDKGQSWSWSGDATADDSGQFTATLTLPTSFVATYAVVATGAVSGTAKTAFTDGNVKFDLAPLGDKTTFVETVYTAAGNCTGAVKSPFPKTLNASNGDNVGVGNNESIRLDAAATDDLS
jgi:hypothetical protein